MRRATKKEMWVFAVGQLGWSILAGIIGIIIVIWKKKSKNDQECNTGFLICF